jgi:hypothetical protein
VTTDFAFAETMTGQDPAPAETMYEVISGAAVVDGVQRTVTPPADSYATTFVGAVGAAYVAACAIGVRTVAASAATADAAMNARFKV